jgi:hypothetical protein
MFLAGVLGSGLFTLLLVVFVLFAIAIHTRTPIVREPDQSPGFRLTIRRSRLGGGSSRFPRSILLVSHPRPSRGISGYP